MKKTLLIALVVTMGMASFAQKATYQIPKVNSELAKKTVKATKRGMNENALQTGKTTKPSQNVNFNAKAKAASATPSVLGGYVETKIGETTYDLQTNGSVCNRLVANSDGTIQATWTFSAELNASWSDRGAGYNFFDGNSWGPFPTARIEGSTRTGWPEIVTLANGREVVISHAPAAAALMMSTREPFGSGTWNVSPLTSLAPSSILWPRAASGGPDGNTIHLIAHNDQAAAPVNGVAGMIFYSRSLDGGTTWDIQSIQIPGFDNTNYAFLSADGYGISAKGNNIAIIYFGALERTVLAKSTDNGTTWTSQVIFDIPFIYEPNSQNTTGTPIGISDLNGDEVADTLANSTDGTGALIIDNNGLVHVFFGFMDYLDDVPGDGSWSYFPGVNGIGYWNENFGNLEPQFIAGALDIDGSGVLLDNYPTIDIALYYGSLTTMPNAAIDANGCLYVVYAGIMETMDQGAQFYRHVYGIKSCDNGCTWSFPIDLTPNDDFAECVFPSMAHNAGPDFNFIYQKDPEPGLNLQGDADAVGINEIMHVKDTITRLDTITGMCIGGITSASAVFCAGDSILLSATCGTAWAWSTGATTQSAWVKTFGLTSVDITTECGVITDDVTLSSPIGGPTITLSASSTIACPGDSITLSTNIISGGTWTWSTGDNTPSITVVGPGTYSVTVSNCGGPASSSVTINPSPGPTVTLSASSTTACSGDSITLSTNNISGGTWIWSTGGTTQSIIVVGPGTYSVTVSDCGGSDSTTITIDPFTVNAIATAFGSTSFCQNGSVNITGSGAGTGGTYLWNTGATTSFILADSTGDYTVTAYNVCGDSAVSNTISVIEWDTCVVSINEILSGSNFSIYPNPNDGLFMLTFNNPKAGNYTVSIKNILGQVVYSKKLTVNGKQVSTIDITEFNAGVYFLAVTSSEGEQTQKVIVR